MRYHTLGIEEWVSVEEAKSMLQSGEENGSHSSVGIYDKESNVAYIPNIRVEQRTEDLKEFLKLPSDYEFKRVEEYPCFPKY